MKNALVVGAGFAGATAARTLAEAGWKVVVIDKRLHVAGNAHDYVNEHGIRVHTYGPHLWHTSNDEVQTWASRFTEWVPYEHRVKAQLPDGSFTPLPINNETIADVFGDRFVIWAQDNGWERGDKWDGYWFEEGAHEAFLQTLLPKDVNGEVTNSYDHVVRSVGQELCDLFFAPYTKKMWGLTLEQLPSSVAARIPTNVRSYDDSGINEDRYFPKDKHQYLPKDGYTAFVTRILDHENITVHLGVSREMFDAAADCPLQEAWFKDHGGKIAFDHVFTSEPIDVYYGCDLGELPWRSIKMHVQNVPLRSILPAAVVNFTHDGPWTRVTEWKKLPCHGENPLITTLTFEEPCDYRDNSMERYYPVKTADVECPHRALYRRYKERADQDPKLTFIGRCGLYAYLDMGPCISSTLAVIHRFLENDRC